MKLKPTTNWSALAVTVSEEVGRRWLSVWGGLYRDSATLLANSPLTRTLAAESARSYHATYQDLVVTRNVETELKFIFDGVAQSVGPRYIKLPDASWAKTLPKLADVTPREPGKEGSLKKEQVVVRVEVGLLSVTLVGLRPAPVAADTLVLPSPSHGEYNLRFQGGKVVPLTAAPLS